MKVAEKLIVLPKKKDNKYKFQAIILEEKCSKNSYNGKILGRKLADWVAFACNGLPVKILQYDSKTAVLDFVKDHIDNSYDYTLVLLSKTPLLQGETIKNIMEYCSVKDSQLCKLPVGYVVDNIAIKTKELTVDSIYTQNLDDFYVVEKKPEFVYAEDVWQDRINSFHISNGVDIIKPKSVLIEPEVDIASGVIVYSGNVIKGQTIIGKNTILKENNVIENCRIGNDCCVSGSVVTNSTLSDTVYVSAFCEITESKVGQDSVIGGSCKINNFTIKNETKIAPNTVLGDNNDSDCGIGKSGKNL